MNRRSFVGAVVALLSVPRLAMAKQTKYGHMDTDRWFQEGHFGKRVFCDGIEITDRCREFDDVKGCAVCFVMDENSLNVIHPTRPDEALTECLHGRIEVRG